jgi:hypothetical protein
LLMGVVQDSGLSTSPDVTWKYEDGRITNVSITRTPLLTDWAARVSIRTGRTRLPWNSFTRSGLKYKAQITAVGSSPTVFPKSLTLVSVNI